MKMFVGKHSRSHIQSRLQGDGAANSCREEKARSMRSFYFADLRGSMSTSQSPAMVNTVSHFSKAFLELGLKLQ